MKNELLSSFLEVPESFYEWILNNSPSKPNSNFITFLGRGCDERKEAKKIYQENYHVDKFGILFKEFLISSFQNHAFRDSILGPGTRKMYIDGGPEDYEITCKCFGKAKIFFGSKNDCRNIVLKNINVSGKIVSFSSIYSFKEAIALTDYSIALN